MKVQLAKANILFSIHSFQKLYLYHTLLPLIYSSLFIPIINVDNPQLSSYSHQMQAMASLELLSASTR